MTLRWYILPITALTLMASLARADFYAGVGYLMTTYEEDGIDEAEPTAISVLAGQQINDYIAGELRAGVGIDGDKVDSDLGVPVEVDLDKVYGVYAKLRYPTESGLAPYVLGGYSQAKTEGRALGMTVHETDSDFSMGAGLEWCFGNTQAVAVEYLSVIDKSNVDIGAGSVSWRYVFR